MSDKNQNSNDDEIVSLNIDDLDVEELEQRLELAVIQAALTCTTFTCPPAPKCITYCNGG